MKLGPMTFAFCLVICGFAHAQYMPGNPFSATQLEKFSLEQKCILWAEKHIGAEHVPAQCEIYVDPIPDTPKARDKVYTIQTHSFSKCVDQFIRVMSSFVGDTSKQTSQDDKAVRSTVLGRVGVCQEDNAMTDEQTSQTLGRMLKDWNAVSSESILDPAKFSPDRIKNLLTYWTKIVAGLR